MNPSITALGAQALDSNVDIKLLVILKDENNATSVDSCRGERVLWTLDNSFEYIEIEKSAPTRGTLELHFTHIMIISLADCLTD